METDYVGYVSASCKGGQGPGGWGLVLVKDAGKANPVVLHERGGEALSSSNRMTLVAAVEALSKVSGNASITILSNNTYITNGMNSWVHNWKRNGWKSGSGRSPIKNVDLWKQLLELTRERHVRWRSDMSNSDRKWVAEAANLARQAVSEVRDQCP
ncbi:MAG: ribonuclease HI [Rhodobacteraceae bacterium]|nr:ribonuclease HI [Paracoccaceae bacterium]